VADLYIDGRWVPARTGEHREIRCPADGSLVAEVDEGGAADTDAAIAAAHAAFHDGPWPHTSSRERGDLLLRLADLLERDTDEIARMESLDTGKRFVEGQYDVADVVSVFRHYGRIAAEESGRVVDTGNPDVVSRIVHEPIGVCGLVTPWNYPLLQVSWKVAPCLAAGNTFVLKPSELTPHSAIHLMRLLEEAGLPPGVGNLVLGPGATAGAPLSTDPRVDMVSFTGSTRAGTRVAELAAPSVKKVALELGGKSANVILPDADLEKAVKVGLANCFINSGQTCTAWTRMLVHESQYDKAVELAAEGAAAYATGDPLDDATRLGPLVSGTQRERVVGYIQKGIEEGARVVVGGAERPHEKGHFVSATVFADVTTDMTIAQEEIFGPVLSIIKYADEDEALKIANDSEYGLAGAVWAGDQDKAIAFARKMRTGQVDVNGGSFNPVAPFGGYKKSGIGRELGRYGIEEFLQPKSLQL
jgi:betaine-aldehyde dehydrogenase